MLTTGHFEPFSFFGIVDGLEVVQWDEAIEELSSKSETLAKRAWIDSEMDGDQKTVTKTEFVQFLLRSWGTVV